MSEVGGSSHFKSGSNFGPDLDVTRTISIQNYFSCKITLKMNHDDGGSVPHMTILLNKWPLRECKDV